MTSTLSTTRSVLARLIELPDLARTIQALPPPTFAALVRKVGLEDAGEIVALASTEQLVHAFDEDLFVSERVGERETLDVARFAVWLEILLEAGDEVAAARVTELDEDFVAHALSGLVLVLEEDALRERLDDADHEECRQVDKALESALTEDLDGYLLVARQHEGWDAALALILALDRNHRALLVRLLDRLARVSRGHLEDLAELSTVLTEGESLADDAEAARERRRGQKGYVEAQAARAFLAMARNAHEPHAGPAPRDPLTEAYFRELEPTLPAAPRRAARDALRALLPAGPQELDDASALTDSFALASTSRASILSRFLSALRGLSETEPRVFSQRMEEFAYLANVLLAGHEQHGARLRPKAAAEAVLATVCYGAAISLPAGRAKRSQNPPTVADFTALLQQCAVDLLFRQASGALASGFAARTVNTAQKSGLLYSAEELEAALAR
jgi:hypothetical protein